MRRKTTNQSKCMKDFKNSLGALLTLALLAISQANLYSQTAGLIIEPATGVAAAVLDPNGE